MNINTLIFQANTNIIWGQECFIVNKSKKWHLDCFLKFINLSQPRSMELLFALQFKTVNLLQELIVQIGTLLWNSLTIPYKRFQRTTIFKTCSSSIFQKKLIMSCLTKTFFGIKIKLVSLKTLIRCLVNDSSQKLHLLKT